MENSRNLGPTKRENIAVTSLALIGVAVVLFWPGGGKESTAPAKDKPRHQKVVDHNKAVGSLASKYSVKIKRLADQDKTATDRRLQGVDTATRQYGFSARRGTNGSYVLNVTKFDKGPNIDQVTRVDLTEAKATKTGYEGFTLSLFKDISQVPAGGAPVNEWTVAATHDYYHSDGNLRRQRSTSYVNNPSPGTQEQKLTGRNLDRFSEIAQSIVSRAANHKPVHNLPRR